MAMFGPLFGRNIGGGTSSVVVVGALAWLRILPDGAIGSNIGGGMLLLNTGGG